MGILLGLQRPQSRSPKGERSYAMKPFYRGAKLTVIGAMTLEGIMAIKPLRKSMKGEDFLEFIKKELVPSLRKGQVVVMDNLPAHKVAGVKEAIENVEARVEYLSPYSPEYNPIEKLWSQIKLWVRQIVVKSYDAMEKLVKIACLLTTLPQIKNWYAHSCYCTS